MSEKIYAWLLRLYPSRFRETYGDDALQLFRDRARDERGFFHRLRLWLDLIGDLANSLPGEYLHIHPAHVGASAQPRLAGIPSFFFVRDELPRPGAMLFGCMMSLLTLTAIWGSLNSPGNYRMVRGLASRPSPGPSASTQRQFPRLRPMDDAKATMPAVTEEGKLDTAEKQRVVNGAIDNLKRHYVYPEAAQKTAESLLVHEMNGDDDPVTDGAAFARLLTSQMRDASNDMHLEVVYSEASLPEQPRVRTAEDVERYRRAMEEQNCTFEKVEILPHNIGYLKLNSFPNPSVCEATARAAMNRLNGVDAIIFDLRDNRGGEPDMVMLMAAYLFDHPEYMYNPRENTTERSWTQSPVAGNKLAHKPAFLLTSGSTASGAEHFSYDLKMLKRATLVGETTAGAAHSGVWHRIDDHFGMGVTETKPINPFSKTDWAVVGVEPDVKVKAADALKKAEELAVNKLQKK
jgi:hypothetical protein